MSDGEDKGVKQLNQACLEVHCTCAAHYKQLYTYIYIYVGLGLGKNGGGRYNFVQFVWNDGMGFK